MNHVTFSMVDQSGWLQEEEIARVVQENAPILERVKTGEERYRQSLGWLDVDTWAGSEWLDRYEALAKKVQAEAEVLVVIGIGGSNQAARAVVDAIGEKGPTKVVWAGNSISADSVRKVLDQVRGKRIYVDLIAKNFETLEPGIGFRVLRDLLREQYGADYASRVICTGTQGSSLEVLCKSHGFTFLPFPREIGGRFTALSPIGLFPMAVAGLDIRAMAAGARELRSTLCVQSAQESEALRYAVIRNLLYQKGFRMALFLRAPLVPLLQVVDAAIW